MSPDSWLSGDPGRKDRLKEWGKSRNHYDTIKYLKNLLEEGEDKWEKLKLEDIRKIKKHDKEERFKRIEEKRKKFGQKNVKKKEPMEEKRKNDLKLKKKIELAEIKTNMWRMYQDKDGNLVEVAEKITLGERDRRKKKKRDKNKIEEDKVKEAREDKEMLETVEKMEREREKKRKKAAFMRECWILMHTCIKDAEDDDIIGIVETEENAPGGIKPGREIAQGKRKIEDGECLKTWPKPKLKWPRLNETDTISLVGHCIDLVPTCLVSEEDDVGVASGTSDVLNPVILR